MLLFIFSIRTTSVLLIKDELQLTLFWLVFFLENLPPLADRKKRLRSASDDGISSSCPHTIVDRAGGREKLESAAAESRKTCQ